MASIKLLDFGGEIPSRAPRLLPDMNSKATSNVRLSEGALDTYPLPIALAALLSTTKYVFRIPTSTDITDYTASFWMEFTDEDTRVIKAPIANDSFERFYWAVPGAAPRYNTKARILAASASYILGIPAPAAGFTSVTPTGGVGINEVRAYVFTYVSAYGEEGPPSEPTVTTGKVDDSWALVIPAVGADATDRNITLRRIYRTVSGIEGDTNFYLVVELPIATLSYNDTVLTTTVTAQGILPSTDWAPPPTTLEGFVTMPNGIVAGFTGRDVWFCEPYRPHAWPAKYAISVEHPIVGLGVFGTTVVILTTGNPYSVAGIHPDSMSQQKHQSIVPCLSAGSIVSSTNGVYFASVQGLMLADGNGIQVVTEQVITKQKWEDLYDPRNIKAVFYKNAYVVMRSAGVEGGFIAHLANQRESIVQLEIPAPADNFLLDAWTGDPLFITNDFVYTWDSTTTEARLTYIWRSKEFHHPKPINYAALKVYFDDIPTNSQSLNADPWAEESLALLDMDKAGELKVYADRVLVWTRDFPAEPGTLMRLPTGLKAEVWEVEITSRVRVDSLQMSTSVRELQSV